MHALLYEVERLISGWRFLEQRSWNIVRKGGNAQLRGTSCGIGVEILQCIEVCGVNYLKGLAQRKRICVLCFIKLTGWKADGDFSGSEARTFFGKADMHSREARAAALVLRYCHALKHAECNIWSVLAQSNGYACFVVLSLQATKGVRQHIATPLAPLLRSKPCQCLPSFFG